ncbi:MAG: immunoglobulin domain-containing protein [Prevotellaceae bacterium]|jgi:hypothetical protein|nr:immunoglobulin domain-containing protein [Prevotellaceae bacterium]
MESIKKSLFFSISLFCILAGVSAQTLNYHVESEKTYLNNTRICYFEIYQEFSEQQKHFIEKEAKENPKIIRLLLDGQTFMFESDIDYTVDSIVNFFSRILEKSDFSEVHTSEKINAAPAITADACDNITQITGCGTNYRQTVTLSGSGSWSSNPCYYSSPGKEKIYSFTPTTTGFYNLVVTSASGYVDYLWKSGSCSSSGWTCIDDIYSSGSYTIGNLTAGTTYYILLDSESTLSRTHSFYIECASSLNLNDNCSGSLSQPNGCTDAAPFCTSNGEYCFPSSTITSAYGTVGCLYSTPGPAWYWMEIDQPGNLQIYIEQRRISDGALVDVDFIAWGPFNSVADACAQKRLTGGSNNHNHNQPYPYGNIVDCCYCVLGYETLHINNAQSGEVYLLLLTNYSRAVANISFSKTGGTATTNCGIITPPASCNGPLCLGETLQLSAQTSSITGVVYNWTGPNGFTSNLQNPTIPNVTQANAGTYTLIITTSTETGNPTTTEVVINLPSDTTFLNDTICQNLLPYSANGFVNLSTAGRHFLNLQNINQCDSVIALDLVINLPSDTTFLNDTICQNLLPYSANGFVNLSTAGRYLLNLQNINQCDSVVALDLVINLPSDTTFLNDTICQNLLPYSANGFVNLSTAGRHFLNLQNINQCDSVVALDLVINLPSDTTFLNDTICQNLLPYSANGFVNLSTAGRHFLNLQNINQCDSVVALDLVINLPSDTTFLNDTICPNQFPYQNNGFNASAAGTYLLTLQNEMYCDSIVKLILTVNPVYNISIFDTICQGGTYTENNFNENSTGIYSQSLLSTQYSCDSIVTLYLTVSPTYFEQIDTLICENKLPFTYGDSIFYVAGTKDVVFHTIFGCDSIISVNLAVQNYNIQYDTVKICANLLPFEYNDTLISDSGIYQFYNDCNILILDFTVLPNISKTDIIIPQQICADDKNFTLMLPAPTARIYEIYPTTYEISFDNPVFDPQKGEFNNKQEIIVKMPEKIYPDNYSAKIILSDSVNNCTKDTINIDFPVLYPDTIMQQKWNDVIALLNRYYNGGFDFKAYQWYKNDTILAGEVGSYIYLDGKSLKVGDMYKVLITREDNSQMFSCPFEAHIPKKQISDFPTVVQNDNSVTIYLTNGNAIAKLWTVTGILLQTTKFSAPMHNLSTPSVRGSYLLEVVPENQAERRVVTSIVVR